MFNFYPNQLVEDKSNAEEIEKAILSLSEAAKKMDPSPLAAYLDQVLVSEIRVLSKFRNRILILVC